MQAAYAESLAVTAKLKEQIAERDRALAELLGRRVMAELDDPKHRGEMELWIGRQVHALGEGQDWDLLEDFLQSLKEKGKQDGR